VKRSGSIEAPEVEAGDEVSASRLHDLESIAQKQADTPILGISRLLWERRKRLARGVLAGLVAGVVLAVAIPSSYNAEARLMPPDQQGGAGMAMLAALGSKVGLPMGAATDLLGMKNSGSLFVGVLQSRTVQDALINRFDLRRRYWRKTYVDARKKLESRTDILEDRKTGIITVEVSDHDPKIAAALAQAYVEELNRLVAQLTTSSAHREKVFLEQRLALIKDELLNSEVVLSRFSSENAALDIKEQGKSMVEAAAGIQGQLIAAEAEKQGLEQIYSAQNVRIRSVQARIQELQRQLEKLGGKTATAYSPADQLYPTIRQLPLLGVRYYELYRTAKINEAVFETLTQQYELAKVQEAKEIPTVRILDNAEVPEKKSFPPRMLIVLGVGVLGFIVMAIRIVAREFWMELDSAEPHKAFLVGAWSEGKSSVRKYKLKYLSRGRILSRDHSAETEPSPQ
jgi:uncharacterized protein involved in exopolysaccharide biosynthesis